jgi:transposase-like protein
MSNERKEHTPEEKVAILRRHLINRVPVSTLCDENQLHPTVFYRWLKQFFENGAAAFGPAPRADKQVEAREQRIAFLEAKLKNKDEVLAELMEEDVALKKVLGRFEEPMCAPRHARSNNRLCALLERADGDRHTEVCALAGGGFHQVLRLASPLRESEGAQRLGSPRLLVAGLGEAGHPRLLRPLPAGRLPAADLLDPG